jgi:uncharacterized protein (TIGR02246 family)
MADTPTLEALLAQWISAFNRHDLDAHVDLYSEEATLFGSVDELQVGRKAIRNYFGALGPNTRVNSYPMPRTAMLGPDLAIIAGHVDFADGDVPVPYRMTWVVVKREGNWRIIQHHGSPRRNV